MPFPRRLPPAASTLLTLALITLLAACSPTSTADPTDLRKRLAEGLRDTSPAHERLVLDPQTTLTAVSATWLPGWRIVDVQNQTPPHPRRFYAAVSDQGRVEVLSGQPARLSALLSEAGVRATSERDAIEVTTVFLDTTRDFVSYAYRLGSVDDIAWRPGLTAEQQAVRDRVTSTYADQVTPPSATRAAGDWTVSAWTIAGADLVRHEVSIGPDGTVTDRAETVASDLPVPASR